MDYQIKVNGEEAFKCIRALLCIGSSQSGYELYHATSMSVPEDADFKPYLDADGNTVEIAANHPLTLPCAKGTWFKLVGNIGDVVVTY